MPEVHHSRNVSSSLGALQIRPVLTGFQPARAKMADVAMGEAGAAVRARPGGPRTIRPLYKAMQLAAVCACARRVIVPCARARVALRHVEARPRHPTHAQEPPKKVPITLLSGFLGT